MQLMPGTAKDHHANPWDPTQSGEAAAEYLHELQKKYRGDLSKALAAYNYGPGNLDAVIKQHPTDWLGFTPAETQNYVNKTAGRINAQSPGVVININNNTGGNAVVAASQLAQ
jgi:soluble lytic murein transglycosylase-like protein